MTERYDTVAARHYAAFRPPLHDLILGRALTAEEFFSVGLDVGCGTGRSAVALASRCARVFGLDPSASMLEAAQGHPKVTYLRGSGDSLSQLPVPAVEVVTFAGSLFYAKGDRLRRELVRVCPPGGLVVAYDFEVRLDEAMEALEVDCPAVASDYDYQVNLCDWPEFATDASHRELVRLAVSPGEMAHLLLADSNRFDAIASRYSQGDPFAPLVECLSAPAGEITLQAQIYYTRHRVMRT